MTRLILPAALCLACLAAAPVRAADEGPVLVGAGIRTRPAYDGAAERHLDAIPVLRVYASPWFARTTQGMLEGGLRAEVTPGLAAGVQLAWEGGRPRDQSDFLREHGIENIPVGASLGAHLEWDTRLGPSPVNLLARWRRHTRAGLGAQADLRITAGVYGGERLLAAVYAQATWANAESARAFYGLTPAQAAASALPAYDASSGLLFTAAGALWSWSLAPRWLLVGSAELRQLRGSARASPLARDATNEYATLGIAYRL